MGKFEGHEPCLGIELARHAFYINVIVHLGTLCDVVYLFLDLFMQLRQTDRIKDVFNCPIY